MPAGPPPGRRGRAQPEQMMSTLTLMLYGGVAAMILAALAEAVRAIQARPVWEIANAVSARPVGLQLVETVDRRQQQLPFVGQDRRRADRQQADAPVSAQAGS